MNNRATPREAAAKESVGSPRTPNTRERQLKQRIQRQCEADRALLMAAQPFTARLLMQLSLVAVVDDRLPTAGTDGETLFVNAAFMARRSDKDRRFILAHEVWHCALGHHRRQLSREPGDWNRACDYEVNHMLHEELGYCPADALYHRRYLGQSAEQVYADLCQHTNRRERGRVLDEHDMIILSSAPSQVMNPDFTPRPVTPEGARAWQQRLVATAQQPQHQQGTLPGHIDTLVQRLRRPQVPWQHIPADAGRRSSVATPVAAPCASRPLPAQPARSDAFAGGGDRPSGSCQSALPHFLGELKSILGACDWVSLEIMEFDTHITQRRQLYEGQLHELEQWHCRGGGGSDIRPVFTALEKAPPQVLVALTDGYINVPSRAPSYPVIWCLAEHGRFPIVWGQALSLEGGHVRPATHRSELDGLLNVTPTLRR